MLTVVVSSSAGFNANEYSQWIRSICCQLLNQCRQSIWLLKHKAWRVGGFVAGDFWRSGEKVEKNMGLQVHKDMLMQLSGIIIGNSISRHKADTTSWPTGCLNIPELLKVHVRVLDSEGTGCQAAHRDRVCQARVSRDSPGRICAQGHPMA